MESYYTPMYISEVLKDKAPAFCTTQTSEKIMNEAVSFDIETTSTVSKRSKEKIAFMYCWMLDIFDTTIFGRTWDEFIYVLKYISNYFKLNQKRRIIIYVHSLSYEFQFIRKWFEWTKIFATEKRKPLYAINTLGFEFRCSYRLSGYKLAKIGEQVGIEKLPDFDYRLLRTYKTPLTEREKLYCIHDVKIVSAYIRKLIKDENGIIYIPLTNTGFVRRLYRHHCIYGKNSFHYRDLIKQLTLSAHEYDIAKLAFAGGFTHSSFLHSRELNENVTSFDFASAYPAAMVSEKFPMSKGVFVPNISKKEFSKRLEMNCCIFQVELIGVEQRDDCIYESYISRSRCFVCENAVVNNGRIWSADRLITTITNVDFDIIKKMYKVKEWSVSQFYYYEKGYLPTDFVKTLLELYRDKTTLKDIKEKIEEYNNAKRHINASFGMCVTDIVRDVIEYIDNEWKDVEPLNIDEKQKQIDKENSKKNRFLFFLWGVFTTAFVRKNLFMGILECKEDYLYSDTDSIKIKNAENHMEFINNYNGYITEKIEDALNYHHIPLDYARPKTIKGKEKPLGIWAFDGFYLKFKSLRAKSYMYLFYDEEENKNKLHMVQAGVNGESAGEYLIHITELVKRVIKEKPESGSMIEAYKDEFNKTAFTVIYENKTHPVLQILNEQNELWDEIAVNKYNTDPFSLFDYGMKIPPVFTGKLTHTYIDKEFREEVYDCKGIPCIVHEKSYIHLEPQDYELSDASFYKDFLRGHRMRKAF